VTFTSVFDCFQALSVLSLLVGAFFAIKDRQENNKENYYFGKRSISPVSFKTRNMLLVFLIPRNV